MGCAQMGLGVLHHEQKQKWVKIMRGKLLEKKLLGIKIPGKNYGGKIKGELGCEKIGKN